MNSRVVNLGLLWTRNISIFKHLFSRFLCCVAPTQLFSFKKKHWIWNKDCGIFFHNTIPYIIHNFISSFHRELGIKPRQVTYGRLIDAYAENGDLDSINKVGDYKIYQFEENQNTLCIHTFNPISTIGGVLHHPGSSFSIASWKIVESFCGF